jgi:hypothetical protein
MPKYNSLIAPRAPMLAPVEIWRRNAVIRGLGHICDRKFAVTLDATHLQHGELKLLIWLG